MAAQTTRQIAELGELVDDRMGHTWSIDAALHTLFTIVDEKSIDLSGADRKRVLDEVADRRREREPKVSDFDCSGQRAGAGYNTDPRE